MENSNKDKYKNSLIKLWKQCCDNPSFDVQEINGSKKIKELIKLNIKDDYINNLISSVFKDSHISTYNTSNIANSLDSFSSIAYGINVENKYLTISKIITELNTPKYFKYEKEETVKVSIFSNKKETKIETKYISLNSKISEIDAIIREISKGYIRINLSEYLSESRNRIRIGIPLLSYGNIFIPITYDEYEELRSYDLDSKRKVDMEDVYRNLTLLSISEYKEFITWKETKETYN